MAWSTYEISVAGFPPYPKSAASRPKALADAFRDYQNYDDRVKFGDFLRMVRVKRCPVPADDGYDYVRRSYGVDVKVGQRVRLVNEDRSTGECGEVVYPGLSTASIYVVIDGRDFAVRVHPSNVAALTGDVGHG